MKTGAETGNTKPVQSEREEKKINLNFILPDSRASFCQRLIRTVLPLLPDGVQRWRYRDYSGGAAKQPIMGNWEFSPSSTTVSSHDPFFPPKVLPS